jgi:hypothetical protein
MASRMGLWIHSLAELPLEARRRYYVYLLDYGWHEPAIDAVYANFQRLAAFASENDAVIIRAVPGAIGIHFADEVLSWHQINGQPAEKLLPAILITTRHPQDFQLGMVKARSDKPLEDALLLIPLRDVCKSGEDVVPLLTNILDDMSKRKRLSGFQVATGLKRGVQGAVVDALVLEPNFSGVGVDIKKLLKIFQRARRR